MKKAAEMFRFTQIADADLREVLPGPLPIQLPEVARAFKELQEERHRADYDYWGNFSRSEALDLVALAEEAHRSWRSIRTDPAAEGFLLSLLLGRRWTR